METLKIGRKNQLLIVSESDLSGSKIMNSMINNWELNNISAKNVKIINANLSDLEIEGAQLGGAYIHNIGMPPEGHPAYSPEVKQRPVRFEDCDLNSSIITNCDLSGVEISDCDITGMRVNGILLDDLLKVYKQQSK